MHERRWGVLLYNECLFKYLDTERVIQRWTKLVANDFSRIGIGNEHQVAEFAINADVSNIAYPKLFGLFNGQFCAKIGCFLIQCLLSVVVTYFLRRRMSKSCRRSKVEDNGPFFTTHTDSLLLMNINGDLLG